MIRLGATMVLVLVLVLVSYMKKIGIGKEFVLALIRGFTQIMILAIVLEYIFAAPEWYFYVLLLLFVMAVMAAHTSSRRAKHIRHGFGISLQSILAGTSVSLITLALTGMMPMRPEFIIPLSGMAFGNSMKICSLTLDRVSAEIKSNRLKIEAALALGADSREAMEPYARLSVRAAMIPTIDTMKTLGVITIPGVMAGMLMGGVSPLLAAEYQVLIFIMMATTGIITTVYAVSLARKSIFTPAHQLSE